VMSLTEMLDHWEKNNQVPVDLITATRTFISGG
jgi:hypothetical protein